MARKANTELHRQWRLRLRRFARSKLSVAEFCRRETVSQASFYQWRKRLAQRGLDYQDAGPTKATFLPVQITTAASGVQVAFPNGATLTLPADDRELIKLSIEALAQAPAGRSDDMRGEA